MFQTMKKAKSDCCRTLSSLNGSLLITEKAEKRDCSFNFKIVKKIALINTIRIMDIVFSSLPPCDIRHIFK